MHQPQDSVVFVVGARGSGKSSWLSEYARGFPRVIVWSPLEETDQYGQKLGAIVTTTLDEFIEATSAGLSVVYAPTFPTPKLFDFFSKVVWHERDALVLVDELADVTPIGKAVGWWGSLVRKGRHHGLEIAAGAQRPAEVDKTIIGNSTRIVCFRMSRFTDRKFMSDELAVDRALLDRLQPLHFLDANRLTGDVKRARLVFRDSLRTYT